MTTWKIHTSQQSTVNIGARLKIQRCMYSEDTRKYLYAYSDRYACR